MNVGLMDLIIQLSVIAFGYLIGGGLLVLILRLAGFPLGFNHATLLVLTLPLIATVLLEMFTGLWQRTPGSLGFGGLVVFYPMLIAGAVIVVAAAGAQRLMIPFDPGFPRESGGNLGGWLLLAFICTGFSAALWRYWPAPTPRLW
jgi:hypothetical protein